MFTEPPECFLGLNTIASSPADTTLPIMVVSQHTTGSSLVEQCTPKASPDEQEDCGTLVRRKKSQSREGNNNDSLSVHGTQIPLVERPSNANRKHMFSSRLTDREQKLGRDASHESDEPDSLGCDEDAAGTSGTDDVISDETDQEEQFQLEMQCDLDLEQIEKD